MENTADKTRLGSFNYLSPATTPSLYRNGKVLTRRDRDGSDARWEGVELVPQEVSVRDARLINQHAQPTLLHNGFEVHDRPHSAEEFDFFDHEKVVRSYYPHCEEIIREACGARLVAAFDHNIRSASGKADRKRIKGGQEVQGPARIVHGDYTLTSAAQRLRDLTRPPAANDTYKTGLADGKTLLDADEVEHNITSGRFAIINLWRNIASEPVQTDPLALCDAMSVQPDDLVVFEIHYPDRIGENYFAKFANAHEWYFYPELTRNEALLIKQWDSAGEFARCQGEKPDGDTPANPCTFSFHSAFKDLNIDPDAPDRWSIEVRCVALYE